MYILLLVFFSIVFENFPISSSSHIFLMKQYMQQYAHVNLNGLLLDDIDYFVQGATACVTAIFFYPCWVRYVKTLPRSLPIIARLMVLGFIAESVTVLCYILFSRVTVRMPLMSCGFIITSCALFSLRYCSRQKKVSWQWLDALLIGLAQGIAFLPGISRFGITFVAARWLGFASMRAWELSFLILWPINSVAFLWGLARFHYHHYDDILNFSLVFIMIIASVVSLISFYGVSRVIKANKLWIFSLYTFVLAGIIMMMHYY